MSRASSVKRALSSVMCSTMIDPASPGLDRLHDWLAEVAPGSSPAHDVALITVMCGRDRGQGAGVVAQARKPEVVV